MATHAGGRFSAEHHVPIRDPIMDTHHASTSLVFFGGSNEAKERLRCAKEIELYIRTTNPEFRFYCENVVTILLVPLHELQKDGVLWAEPSNLMPPSFHEGLLSDTSAFCRHYMLHLDADNLKDPKWQHAVYNPPAPQPDLDDLPFEDWQTWDKAMKYHTGFNAESNLPPVHHNTAEEAKCLDRDGNRCVATGKSSPRVFYFIPFTWNDTVEHMNATGSVCVGAILANTHLQTGPNPAVSVQKLGATHMAWNMLSIDSVLYSYLKDGLCAFRYAEGQEQSLGEGRVQITLEFHWMPKLKGRFGQLMDLEKDWPTLCGELTRFENCSQESFRYGKLRTEAKAPVLSGHTVNVTLPEHDVTQFKNAVNVHWASIIFTAVCGAAGRPWLLSGDDPEDESMMKRQDKARLEEDRQGGIIRKALDLAASAISRGKRKIARLALFDRTTQLR